MNTQTLTEVRNDYKKAPRFSAGNTHEAYICKIGGLYGVTYCTPEEALKGFREQKDGVSVTFIEPLYLD